MKRNSPIGKGGNGKRGGSSKDMITKGLEAVAETVGRFTAKTFPETTNAVDMLKADHAKVKQLEKELRQLYGRIADVLESYTDEPDDSAP